MGEMVFPGSKAHGAWRCGDHANLADGDLIVIGNKTYEIDNNAAVGAGHVPVTKGGSAAADATALAAAINGTPPTPGTLSAPVVAYVDPIDTAVVRIEAVNAGLAGNMTFTTTMGDSDNIIDAVGGLMVGGAAASLRHEASDRYLVTALDVLAGCIMIPTPLTAPKLLSLECYSATGLKKAITSLVTISTTRIKIDTDGATNPAEGDYIAWICRD